MTYLVLIERSRMENDFSNVDDRYDGQMTQVFQSAVVEDDATTALDHYMRDVPRHR